MRKGYAVWKITLWTGAVAAMCALDPDAVVTGWAQAVPNIAVPAAALGLTLMTAANRDRQ